jgi:SAM-dependent methyltransferase
MVTTELRTRSGANVVLRAVACPLCGAGDARVVLRADELSMVQRTAIPWRLVRCRGCEVVYVDGRLDHAPLRDVYEDESYGFVRSAHTDAYVDGRPHAVRVLETLERLVPVGRVLDVGCGAGDFLAAAQQRHWEARGVEMSPHSAAAARTRALDVFTGTLDEADVRPESMDAVALLDVVEHLESPLTELRAAWRALRPGGVLVVETPNWASVYRRILRRWWPALQPRLHLLYLTPRTAAEMLRRAGFLPVLTETEVVALIGPEAKARGLAWSTVRHAARQVVVRRRLGHAWGRLDDALMRLQPATRGGGASDARERSTDRAIPRVPGLLRLANLPSDRLVTALGMGDQLRIYARKAAP